MTDLDRGAMTESIIFRSRTTNLLEIARNIPAGCPTFAVFAVLTEKPKATFNVDFDTRLEAHLKIGQQPFYIPGRGPAHQVYALQARQQQGMSLMFHHEGFPHKYVLSYRGLLLCYQLFHVHHQHYWAFDPVTGVDPVEVLRRLIDAHDENPEQCAIVTSSP